MDTIGESHKPDDDEEDEEAFVMDDELDDLLADDEPVKKSKKSKKGVAAKASSKAAKASSKAAKGAKASSKASAAAKASAKGVKKDKLPGKQPMKKETLLPAEGESDLDMTPGGSSMSSSPDENINKKTGPVIPSNKSAPRPARTPEDCERRWKAAKRHPKVGEAELFVLKYVLDRYRARKAVATAAGISMCDLSSRLHAEAKRHKHETVGSAGPPAAAGSAGPAAVKKKETLLPAEGEEDDGPGLFDDDDGLDMKEPTEKPGLLVQVKDPARVPEGTKLMAAQDWERVAEEFDLLSKIFQENVWQKIFQKTAGAIARQGLSLDPAATSLDLLAMLQELQQFSEEVGAPARASSWKGVSVRCLQFFV